MRVGGDPAVEHMPFSVVIRLDSGRPTQFRSEKQVLDPSPGPESDEESHGQIAGRTGSRARSEYPQHFNGLIREQLREPLKRVRGVPDRINSAHRESLSPAYHSPHHLPFISPHPRRLD